MKEPIDKITRWALLLQTYDYDSNIDEGKKTGAQTHSLEQHIILIFQMTTTCFGCNH